MTGETLDLTWRSEMQIKWLDSGREIRGNEMREGVSSGGVEFEM